MFEWRDRWRERSCRSGMWSASSGSPGLYCGNLHVHQLLERIGTTKPLMMIMSRYHSLPLLDPLDSDTLLPESFFRVPDIGSHRNRTLEGDRMRADPMNAATASANPALSIKAGHEIFTPYRLFEKAHSPSPENLRNPTGISALTWRSEEAPVSAAAAKLRIDMRTSDWGKRELAFLSDCLHFATWSCILNVALRKF